MNQQNRVRKLINLDIKKEIISKRESGKSAGELKAECGVTNQRSVILHCFCTYIFYFVLYFPCLNGCVGW